MIINSLDLAMMIWMILIADKNTDSWRSLAVIATGGSTLTLTIVIIFVIIMKNISVTFHKQCFLISKDVSTFTKPMYSPQSLMLDADHD